MEVVGASRDSSYTRFGAWTYTIAGANRGRTGIFGHSNLVASTITADNYSRDVEATYRGRTVVVTNDGNIFDGAHELSADWADDSSGGRVEPAIRDMRAASGAARLTIGGTEVSPIGFPDSIEPDGVTLSVPRDPRWSR